MINKSFGEWLNEQLRSNGITQAELARKSGLSRTAISDYINHKRTLPDSDALAALAAALHLPVEEVLRAAGILPTPPNHDPLRAEWEALFDELTPDQRSRFQAYARAEIEETRKKKSHLKVDTGPLKPRPSNT